MSIDWVIEEVSTVADPLRLFPGISERLFAAVDDEAAITSPQRVARFLLRSASRKPGFWERLFPSRLAPLQEVSVLLGTLRSAFDAELAGQWRRADFYWNEFQRLFKSQCDKPKLWSAAVAEAARSLALEIQTSGSTFHGALVREVFYEIHGSFYSAIVCGAATGLRADFHLRRMASLLPYTGLGEAEYIRLFNLIEERAQAYCKAKDWGSALPLAELLNEGEAGNVDREDLLIYCTHSGTMARAAALKEARAASEIQKGIAALEALRARFPRHSAVFQALGSEHHLRAVHLANAQQLSAALVDAAKAEAFDPEQDGLPDTTKKLNEMMVQLQATVQTILQGLRSRPNARLSTAGSRMKTQANLGFVPAKTWAGSGEAAAIGVARYEAYVSTIWRRVGLRPEAEDQVRKAEALLSGLAQVIEAAPPSGIEIARVWGRVSEDLSELKVLDHDIVVRWLKRRLLPDPEEPEPSSPARVFPVLAMAASPKEQGEENLSDWLVSPCGYRIKAQMALACVSIVLAVFFTVRNSVSLGTREGAWRQMREASAANDDSAIVQAGERYFSTASPAGEEKGRSATASELYSRALVRWYAAHSGESAQQADARVQRFRERVAGKGYLDRPETGGVQSGGVQ